MEKHFINVKYTDKQLKEFKNAWLSKYDRKTGDCNLVPGEGNICNLLGRRRHRSQLANTLTNGAAPTCPQRKGSGGFYLSFE